MARTGRRSGDSDTREEILAAARTAFGEVGYDRATIRAIAAAAGVDPALVHHYFRTKEDLYAAAIRMPISPAAVSDTVLGGDLTELGERMATLFFSVWEQPEGREPLLAMLRGAMTGNDAGVDAFREFASRALLGRLVVAIDRPDARLRTQLALGQLLGVAMLRYVIRMDPVASAPTEEVVAMVAPVLQHHLVGGD